MEPLEPEDASFVFRRAELPKLKSRFQALKAAFDLKQDPLVLPAGMQDVGFGSFGSGGLGPVKSHEGVREKIRARRTGRLARTGAVRDTERAAGGPGAPAKPAEKPNYKAAGMFILAFALAQVGLACLGVSAPTLATKLFGSYAVIALAYAGGSVAGRQIAPAVIDRLGLAKTHLLTVGVKLGMIASLAAALATGNLTLPLMLGLNAVYGLFHGVWAMTTYTIPPALYGQEPAKLEKFWGVNQFVNFGLGVGVNIIAGAAISSYGFVPVLATFPVAFALSLAAAVAAFRMAKLPSEAAAPAVEPARETRGFWETLGHGARLLRDNPRLRSAALAYVGFYFLTPLVYTVFAPLYGMRLMGAAELATGVSGFMVGFYQLGGLLAGVLMMVQSRRLDAALKSMREGRPHLMALDEEEWQARKKTLERKILKACLSRWMLYGAASLAALAALALPLPAFGSLFSLPAGLTWLGNLSFPALALVPFGFAQNVATIKLWSHFQSLIPDKKDVPSVLGFVSAATLLLSTGALIGLNALFAVLPGMAPFQLLALALLPLGGVYLYLRNALFKSRQEEPVSSSPRPSPRTRP